MCETFSSCSTVNRCDLYNAWFEKMKKWEIASGKDKRQLWHVSFTFHSQELLRFRFVQSIWYVELLCTGKSFILRTLILCSINFRLIVILWHLCVFFTVERFLWLLTSPRLKTETSLGPPIHQGGVDICQRETSSWRWFPRSTHRPKSSFKTGIGAAILVITFTELTEFSLLL